MDKVICYAFEKFGFKLPASSTKVKDFAECVSVPFEGTADLAAAQGVILPQGIFESFSTERGYGGKHTTVHVEMDLMLDRERQLINLYRNGGWICFLVGQIIDTVPYAGDFREAKDTDLCKRLLNGVGVRERRYLNDGTTVLSKRDEFGQYITRYGVGRTVFELPYRRDNITTIAAIERDVYGFEAYRQMYFLPFHLLDRSDKAFVELLGILVPAIYDYVQKNTIAYPKWLEETIFQREHAIQDELSKIQGSMLELTKEMSTLKDYKALLTTSGELFRKLLGSALQNFFGQKVDLTDDLREDFKLLADDASVLYFGEAKGTNKGIKREHINQVDSHRERAGISADTPGILIINNEMDIAGYRERFDTKVPEEQIAHAKRLNVLIIRAIDFLNLMALFEKEGDRSARFREAISKGPGWLKVSKDAYSLL